MLAFALSEAGSLLALGLGRRLRMTPVLARLGNEAHARKLRSLDSLWPLTLVRTAAARGAGGTITVVLTALILIKSALTFVFGLIAVFTLPLSSLVVPAIAAAEAPDDRALHASLERISVLQVTSHVLAAAAGFAIALRGPLAGRPVSGVTAENGAVILAVLALSVVFAIAAGRREARLVLQRGV